MRAPNLLSLAIASGCCLLRVVRADGTPPNDLPPENIKIVPSLAADEDFTITWDGCSGGGQCTVKAFTLLQVGQDGNPTAIQSGSVLTGIPATSIVIASSTYEVALVWQTTSALTTISSTTTESTFKPTSTTGTSPSVVPTSLTVSEQSRTLAADTSAGIQTSSADNSLETSYLMQSSQILTPTMTTSAASSADAAGVPASSGLLASSDSGGLSTGAKVGIAIGAIGVALIVLIGALLIWRRRRQQQLRALPDGMPYSHDTGSTNRDLTAEKEMNVINSPVDTLNNGYSAVPSAPHVQNQPQAGSWVSPDEHSTTGGAAAAAAVPYTDAHRRSYGSGYADSSSPGPDMQGATPPTAAASGSAIQRKPVGATSGGTTHHLREPGMSDEEVARLEEEERRLDEAIAEAERKRQVQG